MPTRKVPPSLPECVPPEDTSSSAATNAAMPAATRRVRETFRRCGIDRAEDADLDFAGVSLAPEAASSERVQITPRRETTPTAQRTSW